MMTFRLNALIAACMFVPLSQAVASKKASEVVLLPSTTIIGDASRSLALAGSNAVLSQEVIQTQNLTDVNQALDLVPGVYVTEEDGLGLRPNISIRAATGYRSSKINLMEDGVLISPAPYAAPAAYYTPTMLRMHGIEVLKGANLLRYGPNTTGGAVNMLSSPIPNKPSGNALISINDRGGMDVHVVAGGKEGSLSGVMDVTQRIGKGYKEMPNGNDAGDFHIQDYVGKLRWDINDDHSLQLKAQYSAETSDETYVGLTDADFKKNPNVRYPLSALDNMKNSHTGINLTHSWFFGADNELTTTLYHNETNRNWYKLAGNPIKGLYAGKITANQLNGTENIKGLKVKANDRTYDSKGIQTNLSLQLGSHALDVGARYHTDDVSRYQPTDVFDQVNGKLKFVSTNNGKVTGGNNRVQTAKAMSFWLTDSWRATDKLTANVAVRHEKIKTTENRYSDKAQTQADTKKSKQNTHSIWLPGGSVSYQATPAVTLLAGVHKGFIPLGAGVDASDNRDPETSVNYEAGIRVKNTNGFAEAIGYYSDFDSVSEGCSNASPCENGATSGSAQVGESAVIAGVELRANQRFALGVNTVPVNVSYTYTDAALKADYDGKKKGDALRYVPENKASISVGIENPKGYKGYLVANYLDGFCVTTSGCNRTKAMRSKSDSLFTVDVIGHVDVWKGGTAFAKVENIADNQKIVNRIPYGARPNMPRTVTLGLNQSF